jgi:hypothetical protein
MGRLADARAVVSRLPAITPLPIPDVYGSEEAPISYRRTDGHRELFLSGLGLAAGGGRLTTQTVTTVSGTSLMSRKRGRNRASAARPAYRPAWSALPRHGRVWRTRER